MSVYGGGKRESVCERLEFYWWRFAFDWERGRALVGRRESRKVRNWNREAIATTLQWSLGGEKMVRVESSRVGRSYRVVMEGR